MGLRRPKTESIGVDYAGRVEAVGDGVTRFRPGDEVFGARSGAFAEYVCARDDRAVVPKPAGLSFQEAASVATAATTALQGLRDKGGLAAGTERARQRGVGRYRHLRGADGEGVRSGSDRSVQHRERRARPLARRRPRRRLHARGLHPGRPPLRRSARHRGHEIVVRLQARARAARNARDRGRAEGRQAARPAAASRATAPGVARRQPEGRRSSSRSSTGSPWRPFGSCSSPGR